MASKYEGVGQGKMWRPLPTEVTLIGKDTDDDESNPFHIRDHAIVTEEFLGSVRSAGIAQPIRVFKDELGRMVCAEGCRRTMALRTINEERARRGEAELTIDAVDIPGGFAEALAIRNAANDHGVKDPPAVRARLVAVCLKQSGVDDKIVAGWYGVSDRTIRTWDTLAGCSRSIQDAVDAKAAGEKGITIVQAIEWASLPHEEQEEKLDKLINPKPDKDDDDEKKVTVAKPSKKTLKAIVTHPEAQTLMHEQSLNLARWFLGQEGVVAADVKGLSELLLRLDS